MTGCPTSGSARRIPALPAIREFLTAATVEKSRSWVGGLEVDAETEADAVRSTPAGLFPWGLASAAFRAVVPVPGGRDG